MHAHIFQHLPFEGPGIILPWLINAGYEISYTHFFSSADIPAVKEVDFLVIMGGSMSVNEEGKHPWLISEKQFIREFIGTGKPVLGICLGSQMIASALGAKVYRNAEKEIGWLPVHGITAKDPSIFQFPVSFIPLHWHGETFNLPEGAVLLATNEATKNQAFQYGEKVLAIQFHPEINMETLSDFCLHFKKELVPGKFIQSEEEIFSKSDENLPSMNEILEKVMLYLSE